MNDEQKQIEEIAKIIIKAGESYYKMPVDIECANMEAVALYEENYRKQSDTVREILQKLFDISKEQAKGGVYTIKPWTENIINLAKQYGVEVEE